MLPLVGTALVTGAGRGLGTEIARALAARGLTVHLTDVDTLGPINGPRAALEPMRAAGRGHVVNVVSLAGLGAPPGEALYAATKHGAIAFSLGALADLRRSGFSEVHVSAVCPDGIWTPMISDKLDDPDAAPSFSGQLLRAEEVAPKI